MAYANLGGVKKAAAFNAGRPNVAKVIVSGTTAPTRKGSAQVVKGLNHVQRKSVGKMPSSAGGVSLGTTHGNHNVAHAVNGN